METGSESILCLTGEVNAVLASSRGMSTSAIVVIPIVIVYSDNV